MKFTTPSIKNLPINSTEAAKSSFDMLVNAWAECKKISELEQTKRTEINAWKETNLAKINAQKTILEQYLTLAFKERAETIRALFERLDKGIENNNTDLINATLGGIIEMAKISPLKEAAQLVIAVNDPNTKSIEI